MTVCVSPAFGDTPKCTYLSEAYGATMKVAPITAETNKRSCQRASTSSSEPSTASSTGCRTPLVPTDRR